MAVGPLDLTAGIEYLRRSVLNGTPWVSANIMTPEDEPFFPPWFIKQTVNGKIGIIGLTSPKALLPEGFTTAHWQEVLPEYLKTLTETCDFIVLLSNLSDEQNAEIASNHPQVHLLISANHRNGNTSAKLHNNTLITQTHTKGKYLGILEVDWSPDQKIWKNTDQHVATIIDQLKHDIEYRTNELERNSDSNRAILKKIEEQKNQFNNFASKDTELLISSFSYRFRALSSRIKQDKEIAHLTTQLKNNISKTNKKSSHSQGSTSRLSTTLSISDNYADFAGSSSCRSCHDKQYTTWQKTDHAKAYTTLELKNQQYDLDCLSCHVTHKMETGSGEKNNEYLLGLPLEMQSVSCESCHGPGKSHVDSLGEKNTFRYVDESICNKCHTEKMDNTFNFNTALPHLNCQ